MSFGRLLFFIVIIGIVVAAIAWQQGLLQFSEKDVDIYTRSNAQFEAFHYQEALDDFKTALRQRPKDPQAPTAMFEMGKCYDELKQPNEAIQAYKDFMTQYPTDERADKARELIDKIKSLNSLK